MTQLRILSLAFFLVTLGATARADEAAPCPVVGQKAPPFGLLMSDGTPGVSLRAALAKKLPVVVNFWAWNCKACVAELPMLQKLADSLEGKATFLLVHPKDEEKMKAKLAELKVTLPSATDDNGEVSRVYCAGDLPRTFVISAKGELRAVLAVADETRLRTEIQNAAKEKER